jgi:hypothetical protein
MVPDRSSRSVNTAPDPAPSACKAEVKVMKAGYGWMQNKEIQRREMGALASLRLKTSARRRSPLVTRHKAGGNKSVAAICPRQLLGLALCFVSSGLPCS